MSELIKRGIFGAIYVLVIIGATSINPKLSFGLFGLFIVLGFAEYRGMFRKKFKIYWTALLLPLAMWANSTWKFFGEGDHLQTILILGIAGLLMEHVFTKGSEHSVQGLGTSLIAAFYLGIPLSLGPEIAVYSGSFDYLPLLGIFILIWTNDTFAYLVGRKLGRHPLSKRLSPKKSIEGMLGGIAFALLGGYLLSEYSSSTLNLNEWLILAIIASIGGTIGDLFESSLKRSAGVKDSGNLIPGHGGLLDRIDSFLFVAPLAWLYLSIL